MVKRLFLLRLHPTEAVGDFMFTHNAEGFEMRNKQSWVVHSWGDNNEIIEIMEKIFHEKGGTGLVKRLRLTIEDIALLNKAKWRHIYKKVYDVLTEGYEVYFFDSRNINE